MSVRPPADDVIYERAARDRLVLPAIDPPWFHHIKQDRSLLAEIAHAVGGPFHAVYPAAFAENLRAFQDTLAAAQVNGKVYFGKKANKAGCWLRVCAELGSGVDVASAAELVHALSGGVRGEDIGVTGAAKSDELLWLAARHGSLIAVDALDELDRVTALHNDGRPVRVLLRVLPQTNSDSRFGLGEADLKTALDRCACEAPGIQMEGFSFHLNGYQVHPRAQLADELVDHLAAAQARGMNATSLSIGGGFAVSYVQESAWKQFLADQQPEDFHSLKTFSHFYPYYQGPTGAEMLAAILATPTADGQGNLADKLRRHDIELLLEPGRALLDRSGFTAFPVQGYKQRDDYGITTVAGLSMSLSEQWKSSEFLPDPTLWPGCEQATESVRSCVGGASCMEYDMISWRKIVFPRAPRYGDLLLYPNTAGYQMDKNESEFHQLSLPPKVVITDSGGRYQWMLDDKGYRK